MENNHYQPEEHYTPDFAAELDSPAEILADQFGITLGKSIEICNWFALRSETQWETAAPVVQDVIRLLIQKSRNHFVKTYALAFAADLADVVNGNQFEGIASMADEAKRLGVTRALMSRYKRDWDKLFGRYGRIFGKSPKACENNRTARLRVLERERAA